MIRWIEEARLDGEPGFCFSKGRGGPRGRAATGGRPYLIDGAPIELLFRQEGGDAAAAGLAHAERHVGIQGQLHGGAQVQAGQALEEGLGGGDEILGIDY